MPFEDFRLEVFAFAAANRSEKVRKVILALAFKCFDEFSVQIEQRCLGNDSIRPFEHRSALEFWSERFRLQAPCFRNDGLVAEVEYADLSVRCLSRVFVSESSTETEHRSSES